ncbi:TetR/AcrR family transcriptional regulator [Nocardioides abyssi]|uniref:TetR/AcrR family transcriptional regulator n=1 Tax=Nocardioides abyssi TaxID=3058370 RepID=A0ABT8ET60_9ACTN|nr:TetR/AcrR family transcriptional regulator [Nocardioides abyssi]MDN4161315.1 TetR/AcrR family transcriptional regulator [Nocardioides abyssi]
MSTGSAAGSVSGSASATSRASAASGVEGRRRPAREEVRRALLDAAARTFARQGIDRTSLDDVAAAAGFTKGAVYSNFGSKEGLVAALADDRVSAYLDLGLAAVDDPSTTLAERAQALGDRLTAASDEQHDWHLLFLELWQRAVRTGRADDSFVLRHRELRATVAEAVTAHAEQAGAELPLPASSVATLLLALSNGLAIERTTDPAAVPDDLMGRVLALLVGGTPPARTGPDHP